MTTTTTSRDWDVEAAYELYQQLNPDTGRKFNVRDIAKRVDRSHTAVAKAFAEIRGDAPTERERLLPYEIPDELHNTTTALRLKQLVHRNRGDKLSEKDLSALESWLAKQQPGMVVVYDKIDEDWAWRRPRPSDKIVHQVMTDRPDEE